MNEDITLVVDQAVDKAIYETTTQNWLLQGALTSLVLIFGLIIGRYVLVRIIRGKTEILDKDQRRWINRINNTAKVAGLIALIFVWAPQLHTFALSLTAVAVAVVLTTKELLMCITGGFLRASTKPFDIGDWVKVDEVTGEVMSITAMTTLIEEIDTTNASYQFTGRTIQIPNSKFLSINIENQNFLKDHVYQDIPITVQYADLDPALLMKQLEKITEKYFSPFREGATKFNKKIEKKAAVDFADADPQYFLKTTDNGHNIYTVRFFVPTKQAATLSANITRDFLSYIHQQKAKQTSQKETA